MKIPFSVYDFFGYLSCGYVLIYIGSLALGITWMDQTKILPYQTVLFIILSYVAGHLIANLSSFSLEHFVVRKLLKSPEETLFVPVKNKVLRFFFPVYYQEFPVGLRNKILEKGRAENFVDPDRSFFLHCHSIAKRDDSTNERLTSFLRLYGFSRNMCFTSFLTGVALIIASFWGDTNGNRLILMGLFSIVLSGGLFYRYLKFFKMYTEEVYRTYEII